MESLFQPTRKSEPTRIVSRGRLVCVNLILPVVVGRMPQWLEVVLAPFVKRFAQEWCPDSWAALGRLSGVPWRDGWGSEGQQWFISMLPVPPHEQAVVAQVAKRLKIDMGMLVEDSRHILAPRGTWGRR